MPRRRARRRRLHGFVAKQSANSAVIVTVHAYPSQSLGGLREHLRQALRLRHRANGRSATPGLRSTVFDAGCHDIGVADVPAEYWSAHRRTAGYMPAARMRTLAESGPVTPRAVELEVSPGRQPAPGRRHSLRPPPGRRDRPSSARGSRYGRFAVREYDVHADLAAQPGGPDTSARRLGAYFAEEGGRAPCDRRCRTAAARPARCCAFRVKRTARRPSARSETLAAIPRASTLGHRRLHRPGIGERLTHLSLAARTSGPLHHLHLARV